MGEHLLCKQGVIGSIPFTSTSTEDRVKGCGQLAVAVPRRRVGNASEKAEHRVSGGCGALYSDLFGQGQ
jgi:hypothetical protein